ncbi:TIGR04283 family arsenosugar biosynthesis glycosyltransferase [uncultured Brachyspira sp.]|uniref:TIGR04283 family arsenosugar biosynthesis glycosyltransferase n=1 Tax=uncultured Brachyspira sp. TaxID=221953 RepID=UPI00259AFFA0|nr:TIGR04283 family arsenosugar biosynthesis glycosyltransferase [uncultured Brachyspira sp.]
MAVSIIIPTLNEEKNIENLLNNLKSLKGDFEVIFSDGGSLDKTLDIIKDFGDCKIIKSDRGRARQLNNGAKESNNDILFFLHADSFIEENVLIKIEDFIKNGNKVGCLKIKFDSKKILMNIFAILSNLRVKYRNIAFGDQGIFIEKKLFEDIGMFDDIPIMEDYKLSIKLKNVFPIKYIDSYIISSSRRFEKNGILKTALLMQKLQYMFRIGVSTDKIANIYNSMK